MQPKKKLHFFKKKYYICGLIFKKHYIMIKKNTFYFILLSFTLFIACTKTNSNNNSNNINGNGGNTITYTASLTGNATTKTINIGDTEKIYITVKGTITTASYTIAANDTMVYNNKIIYPD